MLQLQELLLLPLPLLVSPKEEERLAKISRLPDIFEFS
jgi:hypothetical protein